MTDRDTVLDVARDVATRRDMLEFLSRGMATEYRQVTGEDEIRQHTNYVKSYLLEFHPSGQTQLGDSWNRVFDSVVELADPSLARAETGADGVYFLDRSHERFVVIHTLEKAAQADRLFQELTEKSDDGKDQCWFPSRFLDTFNRGKLTGFSMLFRPGPVDILSQDESNRLVDVDTGEILDLDERGPGFRLTFSSGTAARSDLEQLQASKAFSGRKALSQIEIGIRDLDRLKRRVTNSIYSNGKVVGHGLGIELHIGTVTALLTRYGSLLKEWETDYATGWIGSGHAWYYSGTPFVFRLRGVENAATLESLVEYLFSGMKPFRMFGVPLQRSEKRFDVDAIDLHTMDKLRFEITDEFVRLYLPKGACANAVVRFWRNFEHTIAADTSVSVGGEVDPLGGNQ